MQFITEKRQDLGSFQKEKKPCPLTSSSYVHPVGLKRRVLLAALLAPPGGHGTTAARSQGAILGAAPAGRVAELLQVGDAVEVDEGSRHDQDVEQLVRVEPNVTLSGEEPLRDAGGIQTGSGDVECGHEEEPAHLAHGGGP